MTPVDENILLVENSAFFSLEYENILKDAGWLRVRSVPTYAIARRLLKRQTFSAVILANESDEKIAFAHELARRHIPFAFATTSKPLAQIPSDFRHTPLLSKPFRDNDLLDTVKSLLQ